MQIYENRILVLISEELGALNLSNFCVKSCVITEQKVKTAFTMIATKNEQSRSRRTPVSNSAFRMAQWG